MKVTNSEAVLAPKVRNMTSNKGNDVPNQFIITYTTESGTDIQEFQSYDSIIARIEDDGAFYDHVHKPRVYLDSGTWDYSKTTGTYRNQFLGEGIAETRKKIESGEYILTDLNGGE